jgi:hypothetical protein
MPTAIITCALKGVVLKTYERFYPETQDDSQVALPDRATLIEQARSDLVTERLATPDQWDTIDFDVKYVR